MTEQETQQAQTIAEQTEEIQEAHKILDSLGASKGEPQEDAFRFAAYSLAGRIDDLGDKIAKQAKEIKLLREVVIKFDIAVEDMLRKDKFDFSICAFARADLHQYDTKQTTDSEEVKP